MAAVSCSPPKSPSPGDLVRLFEVAPRDGLQNQQKTLSITQRLAFIRALLRAGLRDIEIGSFVRDDRIPQLSGSADLVRELEKVQSAGARLWALVPNLRGFDLARKAGVQYLSFVVAVSDTFNQRNLGRSRKAVFECLERLFQRARKDRVSTRAYVSTAFYCPYEGAIRAEQTRDVVLALVDMGCADISIADTVGAATPTDVERLVAENLADVPADILSVHFHDTRGTALANILRALDCGIRSIDSAAGGLGGCPFAPGAEGNAATEDVLYMLTGMGFSTAEVGQPSVDLSNLRQASYLAGEMLGISLPSRCLKAGPLGAFGQREVKGK